MSLLRELQRRNVGRVATAYVVASWLIVQVADTVLLNFDVPERIFQVVVIALAIGFVPTVIMAWLFEWTPEGLKRDEDAEQSPEFRLARARRLDRGIIVVLLLAVSYFAVDKFVLTEADVDNGFYGSRSIAVMPFEINSSDPEQRFFANGVADEIHFLLGTIRDLRVIAQRSAKKFHEDNVGIAEIRDVYKVGHLLEGSVRIAGNKVRLTARLIETGTEMQLWTEIYERDLRDVFEIQNDIAANVVHGLKIQLAEEMAEARRTDPEVVALMQQARQIFEIREENTGLRMKALLEKALELDPDYAPAVEWLSYAEFVQYTEGTMPEQEMRQRWLGHRARLLQLDPNSTIVDFNDAWSFWEVGNLEQAAEKFLSVLASDLSDSMYARTTGMFARDLGKLDVAQRLLEHAVAIDPFCFQCLRTLSQILMNQGDIESALDVRERYMAIATGGRPDYSMMLIQAGRPEEVAAAWPGAPDSLFDKRAYLVMAEFSQGNREAARVAARQLDDELSTETPRHWTYMVASVHAWLGNRDRAFELLMSLPNDARSVMSMVRRYHPSWDNLRDDPRWPGFLEYIGRSPERLDAIEFDPWLPE